VPTTQAPQSDLPSPNRSPFLREFLIATILFIIALSIRLPAAGQSLWYDELFTLIHYIWQPWGTIVKGDYSPNNHILFTLLAKALTPSDGDPTLFIRLPSLIAGSLIPLAIVWPVRRTNPKLALAIALIAALHPWLISFSAWARGYALVLLLATLATNLLPKSRALINLPYALLATLTLYTQPLAILIIAAHGFTTLLLRRNLFATWLRSTLLTGLLTFLLYLPFFSSAKSYWSRPEQPSAPYSHFILQSLQHLQWGDNRGGLAAIAITLLILTAGSYAAWRISAQNQNQNLRPHLLTFAIASLFGLLTPLVIPLAGEVRAMLWLIPLYCICAVSLIAQTLATPSLLRLIGAATFLILIAAQLAADYHISTTPAQPIRDAVARASALAQQDRSPIIAIYMAANESRIYGRIDALAYQLEPDPTNPLPSLKQAESELTLRGPPYAIVFYDQFLRRDQPDLWSYLQKNYTLLERLDGRLSPASIYRRKSPPATAPSPR
jgi:hypothetical protein